MKNKTEQLAEMLLNFAYNHDSCNYYDFEYMLEETNADIEKMFTTHDKSYAQKMINFFMDYGEEKVFDSEDEQQAIADRDAIINILKTV